MSRTDDILDQIAAALDDPGVGPDAMRCAPEPSKSTGITTSGTTLWIARVGTAPDGGEWQPVEGATNIDIHYDDPAEPPASAPETERPRLGWAARQMLIDRLMTRHGLSRYTARRAVLAVEHGREHRYAELARAEAQAAMREVVTPIAEALRQMLDAMRPAMENAARAMAALARAVEDARHSCADDYTLCPPPPARPRDRPAWQSPYGPPARRRR